jgi:hypothetical protein
MDEALLAGVLMGSGRDSGVGGAAGVSQPPKEVTESGRAQARNGNRTRRDW